MQVDPFAYRPIFTQWAPITVTGAWNTNVTYAFLWKREDDTLFMTGTVSCTGAPNAASFIINLPTINGVALTIADAKLSLGSTSLSAIMGVAWIFKSGSGRLPIDVTYASSTTVSALSIDPSSAASHYFSQVNATFPVTFANGDSIQYAIQVPILGWGVGGARDF